MGDAGDGGKSSRKPIEVKVFGRTDVGLVREHNEDNFLVADLETGNRSLLPEVRDHSVGEKGTLLAVCDGMGGAAAGEVASQIAVDTVYDLMAGEEPPADVEALALRLEEAVLDAGKRIFDSAKADRSRRGMGTTITAAALISDRMVFAQVGDSRGYLVRKGQMVQVTRDQSLVNQLIEAGQLKPEEAELFEHSNIILQALGTAEDVTVDLTFVDLRKGDTVVMCSDGLSGLVSDEQICELVVKGPEPIDACKALTEAAREGGGHDNITVIVAEFDGEGLAAAGEDDVVEFQRLELPGKKPFSERQQTAGKGGWKPPADSDADADDDDADYSDGSDRAHAASRRQAQGTNPWVMAIAVVVVLALGVGLGYIIVSGTVGANAGAQEDAAVTAADTAPATIECHFVSDVPGTRLVIDGQDYGELPLLGRTIELTPETHSIEGRYGPEIVVQLRLELDEGDERQEVVLRVSQLLEPATDAIDLDGGEALGGDGAAAAPADGGAGALQDVVETQDAAVATEQDAAPPEIEDTAPPGGETTAPDTARPGAPDAGRLTKLPRRRRVPPQPAPPRPREGPIDNNPYQ